jgi:DnaJ-class molecular chaperone
MHRKQARCPDCDGGVLAGNGKCSRCHGSGVNLNLASAAPQCGFCKGTGACPTCEGTGVYPPYPDGPDETIHTLFN